MSSTSSSLLVSTNSNRISSLADSPTTCIKNLPLGCLHLCASASLVLLCPLTLTHRLTFPRVKFHASELPLCTDHPFSVPDNPVLPEAPVPLHCSSAGVRAVPPCHCNPAEVTAQLLCTHCWCLPLVSRAICIYKWAFEMGPKLCSFCRWSVRAPLVMLSPGHLNTLVSLLLFCLWEPPLTFPHGLSWGQQAYL